MQQNDFDWEESVINTYNIVYKQLTTYFPDIFEATLLLLVGWLVAYGLSLLTRRFIGFIDRTLIRLSRRETDKETFPIEQRAYVKVVGQIVFWIVMMFFIAASAHLLGWKMFAIWLHGLILQVPKFISGILIILLGIFLASLAKAALNSKVLNGSHQQALVWGRLLQFIILFTTTVIGIEQMGIQVYFLTKILTVMVGVLLAGGALAFGLGAKNLIANMVGSQYWRRYCAPGYVLEVGTLKGEIIDIGQTTVILETPDGRVLIPSKFFHEQVIKIVKKV